ncbi:MAG: flavin reductase, partial [Proteobacteria bacterium]|nr:flavin reductase [Pseudomonadota bacterium]
KKYDKAKQFETFYGSLKTVPMIKECPYNIECKLIQTIDLPSNEFFIGEIVAVYSDEQYLTNGIPDIKKINPLILSMPESSYFTMGDHIARAWGAGKKLIRK